MRGALLLLSLFVASPVSAQDYAQEAKKRMKLTFDLDEVNDQLNRSPTQHQRRGHVPTAALPLEPNSEIDSVMVFRDRALVSRTLVAPVPAGETSLTFEGLPLSIRTDSFYATLVDGDGRIIGVEVESGRGEVEETERIESVRLEALKLTQELGEVQDQIESLLAQRAYIRATLSHPNDEASPSLSVVKNTLQYVGETERDIAKALRKQEEEAVQLGEQLQPLLIKLENPLATGMRVRVDLGSDRAQQVRLALKYQVQGAHWEPHYNARLNEEAGEVELEYFGVVSQTTGELWDDVELSLSTARPSTAGSMPNLRAWTLGKHSVSSNLDSGRGVFVQSLSGGEEGHFDDSRSVHLHTSNDQNQSSVVFTPSGRRTIAGDGSAHRMAVGSQTLKAKVELVTLPKLASEVYRRARITYDQGLPLIPGQVSTYVGSDFVGSGQINAVVPGEILELSFGTEDRVKVERRLVDRQYESVGIGRRTFRYTFEFQTTVTNFTGTPRTIEIIDQIPVSQSDRVTVKVLEVSTDTLSKEDDPAGVSRWSRSLAPGEQTTLKVRFSVTAPQEAAYERTFNEMQQMY